MKTITLLSCIYLAGTAAEASAEQPPPISSCPKPFQGFFLGANIGYGVGSARNHLTKTTNSLFDSKLDFGYNGIDGGLNTGYNYIFDNKFGLGIEFVANWANAKAKFNTTIAQNGSHQVIGAGPNLKNSLQLRANFSYVIYGLVAPKIILGWDNSLWRRKLNASEAGLPGGDFSLNGQEKSRRNGFLWGLGIDFLVLKHCMIGFEYTGTIVRKQTLRSVEPVTKNAFVNSLRQQYNKFALVAKFIY
ncbi:MAG TPA: autotransporter outer membrane beta-barrel domain-containing protein [Alphaproteobacteria bacterium]|nr:autotransporter outer membrane beta-barrel domain-containing protein [Alphaproteobacteria bacterium]